jgi:hypothetical protein
MAMREVVDKCVKWRKHWGSVDSIGLDNLAILGRERGRCNRRNRQGFRQFAQLSDVAAKNLSKKRELSGRFVEDRQFHS